MFESLRINLAISEVVSEFAFKVSESIQLINEQENPSIYKRILSEGLNMFNSLHINAFEINDTEIVSNFLSIKSENFNPSQYLFNGVAHKLDLWKDLEKLRYVREYLADCYKNFDAVNVTFNRYNIKKL